MALGAVIGGLIASSADPTTYDVLFLLDAGTFVAYAVLLSAVRARRGSSRRRKKGRRAIARCSEIGSSSR